MKSGLLGVLTACLILGACSGEMAVADAPAVNGDLLATEHIASAILSPLNSPSYQVILDRRAWAAGWARLASR